MKIFSEKKELKKYLETCQKKGETVGFVPTMGALHQGHLSLMEKAKSTTDIVVVSIFVNPTQFDNKEDLDTYPQTLDQDVKLLKTIECDVLYAPAADDVYDQNIVSRHFDFDGLEHQMEGKFRDGHFDGVGTVVKTLFEIVQPDIAFFGKKDFQQLQIIKKLVAKNDIPVQIVGCDIYREKDGLAMSSRNVRLTKEHRESAPFIYQTLKQAVQLFRETTIENVCDWVTKSFEQHPNLELEYFTIAEEETLVTAERKEEKKKYRAFIAVFAGKIRLIDNISLN